MNTEELRIMELRLYTLRNCLECAIVIVIAITVAGTMLLLVLNKQGTVLDVGPPALITLRSGDVCIYEGITSHVVGDEVYVGFGLAGDDKKCFSVISPMTYIAGWIVNLLIVSAGITCIFVTLNRRYREIR